MDRPRGVRPEEYNDAVRLINSVFREGGGLAPTIQYEFPTLFNLQNCDNMRAVFDNGRPVSVVSFYKTGLSIFGSRINAACVGGVTTHPEYRQRGLASSLLKDGEEKMIAEGVDLIIISGNSSVYTKQNYNSVAEYMHFRLKDAGSGRKDAGLEVRDICDGNFNELVRLYMDEPVKFIRTPEEFRRLFSGALFEWNGRKHKAVLLGKGGTARGYLILRVHKDGQKAELLEYGGDRNYVYNGLIKLYSSLNLEEIKGTVTPDDIHMLGVLSENHIRTEKALCSHTIKVVNYCSLMEKLRTYFAQLATENRIDNLSVHCNPAYGIKLENEEFETQDVKEINSLVFGCGADACPAIKTTPGLYAFIKTILPVRLPNLKNLNYI